MQTTDNGDEDKRNEKKKKNNSKIITIVLLHHDNERVVRQFYYQPARVFRILINDTCCIRSLLVDHIIKDYHCFSVIFNQQSTNNNNVLFCFLLARTRHDNIIKFLLTRVDENVFAVELLPSLLLYGLENYSGLKYFFLLLLPFFLFFN